MPWWYYDKKELKVTPSIKEGMDFETESQSRREGARFIIETGNKMVLGYNTMATGVVYFHRFYMVHSFYSFPKYVSSTRVLLIILCFIYSLLRRCINNFAVNCLLCSIFGWKS